MNPTVEDEGHQQNKNDFIILDEKSKKSKDPLLCGIHKGKKLINYCLDHDVALCAQCFRDHQTHKIEMIENLAHDLLISFTSVYEDASETSEGLKFAIKNKITLLEQRKKITKEFFVTTRAEIDRMESEFMKSFQEECKLFEVQAKDLEKNSRKVLETSKIVEDLHTKYKSDFERENYAPLLSAKKEIDTARRNFYETKKELTSKEDHYVKDYEVIFNVHDLKTFIGNFIEHNLIRRKQKGVKLYDFSAENNEDMVVYEVKNKVSRKLRLFVNDDNCEVPVWPPHVDVKGGRLFIVGGNIGPRSSKYVFELVEQRNELERRADMAVERQALGVVAMGDTYIFAVGGYDCAKNQWLSVCERYDIHANQWKQIASLNEARSSNSVVALGKEFLYTFGGYSYVKGTFSYDKGQETFLHSIERYTVEEDKWKIIELNYCTKLGKLHSVGAFSIDKSKILIFGGIDEEGKSHSDSFIFKPNKKKFYKVHRLKIPDSFKFYNYCHIDRKIYALGKSNIHVFDTSDLSWEVMGTDFKPLSTEEVTKSQENGAKPTTGQ